MQTVNSRTQTTIAVAFTVRQLREADLPSLEWEGAFSHFRRVYSHAYQRTLRGNAVLWVAENPMGQLLGQVFVRLLSESDIQMAISAWRSLADQDWIV